jgi:spermidine/putrescine transport system substrate-binding protein
MIMKQKLIEGRLGRAVLSRRDMTRLLAVAGVAAVTVPLGFTRARAEEQVIYFTWENYNNPAFYPSYIEANGAPPETPVFADNEEALQKLRAGFVADVTHPCSAMTKRWRDADMLQPIDTARLSHWADLFEPFKVVQGAHDGGKQWFIPVDWGQTSFTYRTDLVDLQGQEESWGLLWDERYKGKLSMMAAAEDAWWCAAILAGLDVTKAITKEDVAKVRPLLEKQRPLLRLYSTDTTSVEQALATGELVAGMTWNESPLSLTKQGVPVKFANPKEGALTWCCGLVLLKNAPHPDKAYQLIDAMIDPRAGKFLIEEFGYGHSNLKAFDLVSAEDLVARGLSKNPLEIVSRGKFAGVQDPEIDQLVTTEYEAIRAGF